MSFNWLLQPRSLLLQDTAVSPALYPRLEEVGTRVGMYLHVHFDFPTGNIEL